MVKHGTEVVETQPGKGIADAATLNALEVIWQALENVEKAKANGTGIVETTAVITKVKEE